MKIIFKALFYKGLRMQIFLVKIQEIVISEHKYNKLLHNNINRMYKYILLFYVKN